MTTTKRHGNKWTINEILSLQREYQLLEWSIQQIAYKHQRSVMGILCKLEAEGFISSWSEARGFNGYNLDILSGNIDEQEPDQEPDQDIDINSVSSIEEESISIDVESDVDRLTERVWHLETSVRDMNSMITQMFDKLVTTKKQSKRQPLRKY